MTRAPSPANAIRQIIMAGTIFRALLPERAAETLGPFPSPVVILAAWPDVIRRSWFPTWPYAERPAGLDLEALARALADVPLEAVCTVSKTRTIVAQAHGFARLLRTAPAARVQ